MKRNSPNIAVCGAGKWGKNLVRNFHALGAVKLVCDQHRPTCEKIEQEYPGVVTTGNYQEVLKASEIAAVVLATPAPAHGNMAELALRAGKDVFVEKPICLSVKQGEALVELAREKNRILMVGHLLWYHPAVLKLKELIDSGVLGRIHRIYSHRLSLGRVRTEENVMWSFAPHDISMVLGLLGDRSPSRVSASGGGAIDPQVPDTMLCELIFEGGIHAHVFASWLYPHKEQKLVVMGDKAMAEFTDTSDWSQKLVVYPYTVSKNQCGVDAKRGDPKTIELLPEEPLKNECLHFLECVRDRVTPRTCGVEGVRVLRVLSACQSSMDHGRSMTLNGVYFAHPTAEIDDGVKIGKGTRIWHFSHVLSGSSLGEHCNVGQNVVIGPDVVVGRGCKIQNNVSIYKGVELEDEVFCGPSMVFTNVTNPRSHVPRRDEFKRTLVKKGATIGANATVVCGHDLGTYCFVGAGAVVTKDVPDYALVVGNPAKRVGWMCACGAKLPSDLVCGECGSAYEEHDGQLRPQP